MLMTVNNDRKSERKYIRTERAWRIKKIKGKIRISANQRTISA